MPRYYIDTFDGRTHTLDETGIDLSGGAQAVRDGALRALPDFAGFAAAGDDEQLFVTSVRDEAGRSVFEAKVSVVARWVG